MTNFATRALLAACSMVGGAAQADDAALYDKAAPKDAAFVRILSKTDVSVPMFYFGETALPSAEFAADTYVAISAADLTGAAAGAYYSISLTEGGQQMIQEPDRETAAKVHLILVNTGSAAVRLVVPGVSLEVIAPIEPGQSASRAVNPITTELVVERVDDSTVLGTFDVALSRGQNLSFVATTDTARLVENSFGPVLTLN